MYWENIITPTPGKALRPQSLVGVGGRHSDVHHRDVGLVLAHRGQQRVAVGHRRAHRMAAVL